MIAKGYKDIACLKKLCSLKIIVTLVEHDVLQGKQIYIDALAVNQNWTIFSICLFIYRSKCMIGKWIYLRFILAYI